MTETAAPETSSPPVPDPGPGILSTLAKLAVPISGLRHYGKNPRRGDVDLIERSLRLHGQYRPIVVRSGTGEVLAGNHTLTAARDRLGWAEIAATFVDVDDDQAARLVLVDNAAADAAGYDTEALASLLRELKVTAAGLDGTGFTDDALDALERELAGLAPLGEAEERSAGNAGALAAKYGVAPFSVLDGRAGPWRERKRAWLNTGLASHKGRPVDLVFDRPQKADPAFYMKKRATEARLGKELTTEEFLADHYVAGDLPPSTSTFDPVLCEQMYRWFCPPGGKVLDPFAGGSVRGIVSAVLGRDYTGVDLSAAQLAENRQQAAELLPGFVRPPGPLGPPFGGADLTPVEAHGGYRVKREDAWAAGLASGAKARTMWRLLTEGTYAGLITAGASVSPQIERAALVAQHLGVPCRVHTGEARPTSEMRTAAAAGAEVLTHRPGRLSVIKARFRDDAVAHPDWLAMPYGMDHQAYVDDVAAQVANLPEDTARVVVPVGSGMTLAGILTGLGKLERTVAVLGVRVGGDPTAALDKYAPGWRTEVELVASPMEYKEHAPNRLGDLVLDPGYEAKCVPFLREGDVLWAVGVRASALGGDAPPVLGEPVWIEGDSRHLDQLLPAGATYDFVFSCPPYADLERYSDDPADLSTLGYDEFRSVHAKVIADACARLKPDRFAVWVVGEVRDRKQKSATYYGFVPDTVDAFRAAGMEFYNEIIYVTPIGSLPTTVPTYFEGSRKVGKTHQNVLVFLKGDARTAAAACGLVDGVEMPPADEGEA